MGVNEHARKHVQGGPARCVCGSRTKPRTGGSFLHSMSFSITNTMPHPERLGHQPMVPFSPMGCGWRP